MRRLTLAMCQHPVASRDAPLSFSKLLSKPVRAKTKTHFLLRKAFGAVLYSSPNV